MCIFHILIILYLMSNNFSRCFARTHSQHQRKNSWLFFRLFSFWSFFFNSKSKNFRGEMHFEIQFVKEKGVRFFSRICWIEQKILKNRLELSVIKNGSGPGGKKKDWRTYFCFSSTFSDLVCLIATKYLAWSGLKLHKFLWASSKLNHLRFRRSFSS